MCAAEVKYDSIKVEPFPPASNPLIRSSLHRQRRAPAGQSVVHAHKCCTILMSVLDKTYLRGNSQLSRQPAETDRSSSVAENPTAALSGNADDGESTSIVELTQRIARAGQVFELHL
jgi:hypothetical protein